jgi:hypothetical protein
MSEDEKVVTRAPLDAGLPSGSDLDQVAAEQKLQAQTSAASEGLGPEAPGPEDPGSEPAVDPAARPVIRISDGTKIGDVELTHGMVVTVDGVEHDVVHEGAEPVHDPAASPAGVQSLDSDTLDSFGNRKDVTELGPRGPRAPLDALSAEEREALKKPVTSTVTDQIDSIGQPQGSFEVEPGGLGKHGEKLPDVVDYSKPVEAQPVFGPRGPGAPKGLPPLKERPPVLTRLALAMLVVVLASMLEARGRKEYVPAECMERVRFTKPGRPISASLVIFDGVEVTVACVSVDPKQGGSLARSRIEVTH